jgi:mono/diheme cytochrome c family protein
MLGLATVSLSLTDSLVAEETTGLNDGIFNARQVKSGKRLYRKHCMSCHEGEYFGPVLLAWQGEPLSSFFEVMTSAMPENDPGSLAQDQYTDLLAYVLKVSDYPQGQRELDPVSVDFSKILIEKPLRD